MPFKIAIIGATGLVGTTLLSILEQKNIPIDELILVASERSSGKRVQFKNKSYTIINIQEYDFNHSNIAFFCVDNDLAKIYIPKALAANNLVIDKSSFYRLADDVPLIVPEVNFDEIKQLPNNRLIANPNCTTIPLAVALNPIKVAAGISRINISTYQSVSGSGKEGVNELHNQTQQLLAHKPLEIKTYSQQIAFNVLPHIDSLIENGYTKEEMKMVTELKKIFQDDKLAINPTAVRVPVFYGHSASVHLETEDKITASQAIDLLKKAEGIILMQGAYPYPTPVSDAAGKDKVYVGRIREDISHKKGLNLWVVADNLRKGAALNAVQIVERLISDRLI